ncbi:ABC transporter substrate-binding protein [Gluconobacter sphaericus]|uniref:Maltose ABC transporter substrate-binding protein n=1 Tax=Gluconobacter sphaericus NBRC 12467 TaxID=1307951 RepID=A0AA37SJK7_9PROT|nr:sugar ABC transporter substrate-binding protein [Gluconobacter sphaericus]MBF0886426.1 sugar ABC transporter substrate-binding protein [Gluconobacter sphaericus]MBS1086486.1 sugar ABC transporter substrate-binding protein [Gluconobacter sphaericus]MBS1100404.1 sugar ABC transporter substrate-binding protein [Gluconobacter sphaericus]GBR51783.1 periplasmic mannitol/sorbitol binding protein [Gluconobacter sphaericus NBRC 12467]GEB43223.1 maltose ABC transporter substrate-binding protein [Gluc
MFRLKDTRTAICTLALLLTGSALSSAEAAGTLTIATVNNGDMIVMRQLSTEFEKAHPDIHLNWVTLEENVLRQRVTTDIAMKTGQFDVVTIGNYEVPIWAKQGWLTEIKPDATYDVNDILPSVRDSLTANDKLYALPFYAESVMTYYRKDLFQKAGLTMPEQPTYDQVRQFADKITDKPNQIYGICLRGKPGWGENMAYISSLANTFGAQWFDVSWKPTLTSDAWKATLNWYVSALKADGPPGATSNGFNENLALFASGHCGIWIDSTVAGGLLFDPKQSQVADKVGFAPAPKGPYGKGPTWLWSWSLAVPVSSHQSADAQTFITWATSKDYVKLVAARKGWVLAPPGTRASTYAAPEYLKAAPFASFVLNAIKTADPNGPTAQPRPYTGAQFVAIPEFQSIGTQVGQTVAATLSDQMTVDHALTSAQASVTRALRQSGRAR